jgi:hypothetical protein
MSENKKLYIMVTTKQTKELKSGRGFYEAQQMEQVSHLSMRSFQFISEVSTELGKIATHADDPREIERIFSVDAFGSVEHYEVVYAKGKLKLCPIQVPTTIEDTKEVSY